MDKSPEFVAKRRKGFRGLLRQERRKPRYHTVDVGEKVSNIRDRLELERQGPYTGPEYWQLLQEFVG